MIDQALRDKYFQQQAQKTMLKDMASTFSSATHQIVKQSEEENMKLFDKFAEQEKKQHEFLDKLGKAMVLIFKKIPDTIKLPDVFKVKGEVDIDTMPPVMIDNFEQLSKYFSSLETKIEGITKQLDQQGKKIKPETKVNNLSELATYFASLERKIMDIATAIENIPAPIVSIPQQKIELPRIEIPKVIIPKSQPIKFTEIIDELKKIKAIFAENSQKTPLNAQNNDFNSLLPVMRSIESGISNLVNRPVMTPQPVNNVYLNPSDGFIKTTDNIVGTTLVTLPQYGQLFNRRSVLIYNNSVNTIYIGGSDVTVGNGLPVPPNSYSPPVDAGYNLPIYAVASQGGNDVRVIEISKDKSGTIQE